MQRIYDPINFIKVLSFQIETNPEVLLTAFMKLFDQYLPYAMAFGVEDAWAEQFKDIYTEEPQWHTGSTGTFSPAMFAQSMQAFSTDFTAASAPASSGSSGGGSVGGGFGGGGGGSW